jgi:superfamily I DNA and/or RNA helicase
LSIFVVQTSKSQTCFVSFVETTNGGVIKEPSWNEVHDHNVIITTLATARMLWKFYQDGRLRFTHILIDEAAQALEPECVTPLVMADGNTKIVLAGDHKQVIRHN